MELKCEICRRTFSAPKIKGTCSDECNKLFRKLSSIASTRRYYGRPDVCINCGKKMERQERTQIMSVFCCDACAVEWYTQKRDLPIRYIRKCKYCGAEFQAASNVQVYCSKKCNNAYHNGAHRQVPAPKTNTKKSLTEVNAEAHALGLTYGQYMARVYAQEGNYYGG